MIPAHPAARPCPTRKATLLSAGSLTPPRRPPVPLLLWGPHDELSINPLHPAVWPARLLYALVIPLVILRNLADTAYRWWISRRERAALHRRGLL